MPSRPPSVGADGFGSKVVVVNTALKVVWIAVAVVLVLHGPWPL